MRFLRGRRPRAVVLAYHRVAEAVDDPYGQAVRPETFARHLEILGRHHAIAPLGELVSDMPEGRYRDGTVAITFDDGYADTLFEALPIAAHLPVTVFVTVEPVLEAGRFWWDEIAGLEPAARNELHARLKGLSGNERREVLATVEADGSDRGRPMTVDELLDLASHPGVEIGAHTLSHPSLARLPAAEQERELAGCRTRLEELVHRPVSLLAYPFGKPDDVSEETQRLACDAGYRAAFTTVPLCLVPSSPLFCLPRLTVHEWPAETLGKRLQELFSL